MAPSSDSPEQLIEQMRVHTLEILLAPDLVDLVGSGPDQDLLARVRGLRRKTALELGIVVPPVRTRDSVDLPRSTYVVKIAGVEVGRGEAPAGRMLALGDDLAALPGTTVNEPVFGLPGKWIPAELRHAAEMSGATVVDRVSVLITHLGALIAQHAARLLGREDVRVLTEGVKKVNPSVVEELIPTLLSLGEVQRVLQGLLAEEVPIRDLGRIYEALTLRARVSTDAEGLVEAARAALGPALGVDVRAGRRAARRHARPRASSRAWSSRSGPASTARTCSWTRTGSSRCWSSCASRSPRPRPTGAPSCSRAHRRSARPCAGSSRWACRACRSCPTVRSPESACRSRPSGR